MKAVEQANHGPTWTLMRSGPAESFRPATTGPFINRRAHTANDRLALRRISQ
jgi:hypothetical protein